MDGRPRSRCLVDGRLSDRGLGSGGSNLGSRSVLHGWFRCGPLLRWLLRCRCPWTDSRFRFRRLRNWIGLGRRVLAGGGATAGLGGDTGIGSAGGATAGFGEPVFGRIVIGPEEGLGLLPGALSAGVGSGLLCGWATFGGV